MKKMWVWGRVGVRVWRVGGPGVPKTGGFQRGDELRCGGGKQAKPMPHPPFTSGVEWLEMRQKVS